MLLQRYLETINQIDPRKIYVENVRSFFKIPTFFARLMCEMAVVDKTFIKKIGVVCPNSICRRIIASFYSENEIPEYITCDICENDENKECTFETAHLEKITFYQLNKPKSHTA